MTEEFKSKVRKESETFTENFESEAFMEGVCFALGNIWHDSKEEQPKGGRYIIAWDGRYASIAHYNKVINCKWCYLEDILPKEESLYWDEKKETIILEL